MILFYKPLNFIVFNFHLSHTYFLQSLKPLLYLPYTLSVIVLLTGHSFLKCNSIYKYNFALKFAIYFLPVLLNFSFPDSLSFLGEGAKSFLSMFVVPTSSTIPTMMYIKLNRHTQWWENELLNYCVTRWQMMQSFLEIKIV